MEKFELYTSGLKYQQRILFDLKEAEKHIDELPQEYKDSKLFYETVIKPIKLAKENLVNGMHGAIQELRITEIKNWKKIKANFEAK